MRRGALAALLLALVLPAAAGGADTFVIVDDGDAAAAARALPSAATPNEPGAIAVDADFATRPVWVEQTSLTELRGLWQSAGSAYGIPWQVLAAINKVESDFGNNMGPSSAGAVGWMQFMPETWLRWGVDANADGVADPWNAADSVYAAARYLAASGGSTEIARAVFSYNHADWYVSQVLALANVYAGGAIDGSTGGATSSADVAAAKRRVAALRDALERAEQTSQAFGLRVDRASVALGRTQLLSDQLLAQKRVTLVGVRYDRARRLAGRLRTELRTAQDELARARAGAFVSPLQIIGASPFSSAGSVVESVNPFGGGGAESAAAAIRFTLGRLGTPYLWGGEGTGGFDCSGLVQAAYASAGISLPRVAQQQYDAGPFVPAGEPLEAGDLVFFGDDGAHISHVGIVAGPGLMIDAPHTGAVVRFDSYERASYLGATRPAAGWVGIDPVAASAGGVVEFATADTGSPTAGEILFTKNA